jgi:hypothetical protein
MLRYFKFLYVMIFVLLAACSPEQAQPRSSSSLSSETTSRDPFFDATPRLITHKIAFEDSISVSAGEIRLFAAKIHELPWIKVGANRNTVLIFSECNFKSEERVHSFISGTEISEHVIGRGTGDCEDWFLVKTDAVKSEFFNRGYGWLPKRYTMDISPESFTDAFTPIKKSLPLSEFSDTECDATGYWQASLNYGAFGYQGRHRFKFELHENLNKLVNEGSLSNEDLNRYRAKGYSRGGYRLSKADWWIRDQNWGTLEQGRRTLWTPITLDGIPTSDRQIAIRITGLYANDIQATFNADCTGMHGSDGAGEFYASRPKSPNEASPSPFPTYRYFTEQCDPTGWWDTVVDINTFIYPTGVEYTDVLRGSSIHIDSDGRGREFKFHEYDGDETIWTHGVPFAWHMENGLLYYREYSNALVVQNDEYWSGTASFEFVGCRTLFARVNTSFTTNQGDTILIERMLTWNRAW